MHKKARGFRPGQQICFAEREGFEPPDLLQSTVFKTAALNRSATSPWYYVLKSRKFNITFLF
jgi:hypothetical protein